jgi:hypothetical protein
MSNPPFREGALVTQPTFDCQGAGSQPAANPAWPRFGRPPGYAWRAAPRRAAATASAHTAISEATPATTAHTAGAPRARSDAPRSGEGAEIRRACTPSQARSHPRTPTRPTSGAGLHRRRVLREPSRRANVMRTRARPLTVHQWVTSSRRILCVCGLFRGRESPAVPALPGSAPRMVRRGSPSSSSPRAEDCHARTRAGSSGHCDQATRGPPPSSNCLEIRSNRASAGTPLTNHEMVRICTRSSPALHRSRGGHSKGARLGHPDRPRVCDKRQPRPVTSALPARSADGASGSSTSFATARAARRRRGTGRPLRPLPQRRPLRCSRRSASASS